MYSLLDELQFMQNTIIRRISKAPCYLRNNVIAKDYNISFIRKNIKAFSKKFYNNLANVDDNLISSLPIYDAHQWKFRKRPRLILILVDPAFDT